MDFGALLSNLNFDPIAFVFNVVGFVVLLAAANVLVFKPIGKVLDEREGDIKTTYDRLEADQRQMNTLKSEYEQRLNQIEAEAREKIQSAIKEAQSARDQIIGEANTRARDMVTRAEREVEYEREQALLAMREQVVDLALGAATKIIGDGLDNKRQRKLISEFINAGTAKNAPSAESVPAPAATPETAQEA
ncbi:MAG: F0F1 ATP synthase subunit B [Capsulimonadales bacterium]|nr:F0F1 ATP synthase subunit B [Capsulimonadales bacterium]